MVWKSKDSPAFREPMLMSSKNTQRDSTARKKARQAGDKAAEEVPGARGSIEKPQGGEGSTLGWIINRCRHRHWGGRTVVIARH